VQSLPALDGAPLTYNHELHAELLFDLCTALTREGLGTLELWQKSEGSCVTFAKEAMLSAIDEPTIKLLKDHSDYYVSVSDVGMTDGDDAPVGPGLLVALIESSGYAYLKVGPAIAALEQEREKGWGLRFIGA
jgi:hypothetical protein